MTRTLTAVALLFALTACGGGEPEPEAAPIETVETPAAVADGAPQGEPGGQVTLTSDDLDPWPLTSSNITVSCAGDALFGVADGSERYALNGTAQTQLGFPSISDVQVEGVSVAPLLDVARSTC